MRIKPDEGRSPSHRASGGEPRSDAEQATEAAAPPSEDQIRELVVHFYGRVREDPLLGPVFAGRIEDWDPHLARMCDFWSGVLRASGRYRGDPLRAHGAIPGLEPAHFRRWLELFRGSAREVLEPGPARDVLERARRMSTVLQRHHPGISSPESPSSESGTRTIP